MEQWDAWPGRDGVRSEPGTVTSDDILMFEMGRSTKSFRASVDLAARGYGEQAIMVNRSLFEGMLVAHWSCANERVASTQFVEAAMMDQHVTVSVLKDLGWDDRIGELGEHLGDESEMNRLERKFGPRGDGSWTGLNIYSLMKKVEDQWTEEAARKELWDFFRVAYRDSNQILHSTPTSLVGSASQLTADNLAVWIGASEEHVRKALYAAFWIYSNTLTLWMDHFEFTTRQEFDSRFFFWKAHFAKVEETQIRDLSRNDLCPCGSNRKLKRCHGDPLRANVT